MKLLIVDNDRNMVEMLTSWLKTLGYQVSRAYTGEQARDKWLEQRPDLVILDYTLQGTNILALCHELRTVHDALILAMSVGRDADDEVRCLEAGADDYLRKPFLPDQLLARIHAMGRRTRATIKMPTSSEIKIGSISFDPLHNKVSVRGRNIRLTPMEGKLLNFLATNANGVCTLSQIVTHVWGFGDAGDISLIKTHIYHLRRKIEPDPSNPSYLLTVPGLGYTLTQHPCTEETNGEQETIHRLPLSVVS